MSRIWRTLKGYLFWTYTRGSFHYDVMVTLILAFIFIAPHFIDFKDKPPSREQHPTALLPVQMERRTRWMLPPWMRRTKAWYARIFSVCSGRLPAR